MIPCACRFWLQFLRYNKKKSAQKMCCIHHSPLQYQGTHVRTLYCIIPPWAQLPCAHRSAVGSLPTGFVEGPKVDPVSLGGCCSHCERTLCDDLFGLLQRRVVALSSATIARSLPTLTGQFCMMELYSSSELRQRDSPKESGLENAQRPSSLSGSAGGGGEPLMLTFWQKTIMGSAASIVATIAITALTFSIVRFVSLSDKNSELAARLQIVEAAAGISGAGKIPFSKIEGVSITNAMIMGVDAGKLSGTLSINLIPDGGLPNSKIGSLDASKISSGLLNPAVIGPGAVTNAMIAQGVDAAKLSGTMHPDRIAANSITDAQISALDAGKLTGSVNAARIGNGLITDAMISSMSASKLAGTISPSAIAANTISSSMISGLDAAKLTGNIANMVDYANITNTPRTKFFKVAYNNAPEHEIELTGSFQFLYPRLRVTPAELVPYHFNTVLNIYVECCASPVVECHMLDPLNNIIAAGFWQGTTSSGSGTSSAIVGVIPLMGIYTPPNTSTFDIRIRCLVTKNAFSGSPRVTTAAGGASSILSFYHVWAHQNAALSITALA